MKQRVHYQKIKMTTNDIPVTTTTPYLSYDERQGHNDEESLEKSLQRIDRRSNSSFGGEEDVDNRSTLTTEGIADFRGYLIINLVVLIGDMARGVMYPTLWPLVMSFGGSEVTQGFIVAAFSFGRILSSPIFGERSTTHGYRNALLISSSILVMGTVVYALANSIEVLILAQTLLGIGSGTLGVTRAFVADVTPTRERTRYMAYLTAVQYAGFTVTPVVGAYFTHYFDEEEEPEEEYAVKKGLINQYSAPAYLMSCMCALTWLTLFFFLKDRPRVKNAKKKMKNSEVDEIANRRMWLGITIYDAAILGCMLLNISTKGSISCFETLGVNFALTHFGMDSESTGYLVSFCGAIGVIVLISMKTISTYLTDVQMINGGMIVIMIASASLVGIKDDEEISMWRYAIVIFLVYSIGYPIGHTAVIGLFSKSEFCYYYQYVFNLT